MSDDEESVEEKKFTRGCGFSLTSKSSSNAYNMAHLPLKSERENVKVLSPSSEPTLRTLQG